MKSANIIYLIRAQSVDKVCGHPNAAEDSPFNSTRLQLFLIAPVDSLPRGCISVLTRYNRLNGLDFDALC